MKVYISFVLCYLCCHAPLFGQSDSLQLSFEGDDIKVRIRKEMSQASLDSLLCSYGTCMSEMDSLWESKGQTTAFGWKLDQFEGEWIEMHKSLNALSGELSNSNVLVLEDLAENGALAGPRFGTNKFKDISVAEIDNGKTRFIYLHGNANEVFLSGSFNGWSTSALPMVKKQDAWIIDVDLPPGRHEYKFIINGRWTYDKNNRKKVTNEHGSFNSVYFKPNILVRLEGYPDAKRVIMAGSFNDWNEKEVALDKTDQGWEKRIYLTEGSYQYKFIVDGQWMLDPKNDLKQTDENGFENSVLNLGEPTTFTFYTDQTASEVVLSGSFNDWNEHAIQMKKEGNLWKADVVLRPGNYEYKFIVDGKWTLDPLNENRIGTGDYENNVHVESVTQSFLLEGYSDASEVICTGSFNGWNESGYTMVKTPLGWQLDLHLNPGKYTYKFIVDGKWIVDPSNPLFEHNEFNDFNSIVWIE